jgi:hypothetical protein
VRINEVVVAADAADRHASAVGEQPQDLQRVTTSFEHLDLRPELR